MDGVSGAGVGSPNGFERLQVVVGAALERGEVAEARRSIDAALAEAGNAGVPEQWASVRNVVAWPDGWLIAAVRSDPPDEEALDALVGRHWPALFARCRVLTADPEEAMDLAQEAWCRILRARRSLKPDGNLPAYLATIAANVWRDSHRLARRAGPLAERRLASLDATGATEGGESLSLAQTVPDPSSLPAEEQLLLRLDVDEALRRLAPRTRDVLVARFVDGESSAEIGRRYGRTEQTITAWVRQGIRELQAHFGESRGAAAREDER